MGRLRTVVFNNPFGSFHDMVAEAKDEREQLDRLLTISTPRERLLVAVVALFLFAFAAWLFLGNVTRSVAVDGVLVEPGSGSLERNQSVQVLVGVQRDVASHVRAGMPAVMECISSSGDGETRGGRVTAMYPVPFSEDLAVFASAASMSVYRFNITLEESLDSAVVAGAKCRIVIEVGRQPPVAFLQTRPS